ncbi:MAG TPA: copper-binding protein [Allosphingosinicella sp.]|nr:copper-binding protein [Allosphingosinicella sp.]
MKEFQIAGAIALALAITACGQSATPTPNQQGAAGTPAADDPQQVYSGEGAVTAVAGDQVSISHGPIQGLGWPAMTMTFRADPVAMIEGIGAGDRVAFQFRRSGTGYTLTSIRKQ